MIQTEIEALGEKIYESSAFITRLTDATANVIVGQENMIDRLLVGLLTKGHILLEGLPGLAKTLAIKTLANLVNGKFSRIQFTPDLLPADIVGTMIYNPAQNQFSVKKGPVFANFVLADEINQLLPKSNRDLRECRMCRNFFASILMPVFVALQNFQRRIKFIVAEPVYS